VRSPVFDVDPSALAPRAQEALLELKAALAEEDWILHAQVTFDHVPALDVPPIISAIPHPPEGLE
jgi:hypothetical protein